MHAAAQLRRVEGPPPVESVPEDATVLVECRSASGVAFYVLAWTYISFGVQADEAPSLDHWYENERGVCGRSDIIAHYRLSPPEWARETNA